jgi:hypothetical protein
VGPIGAFSRSIVSRLTPSTQQSRFFSLYEFSQEATGWIGPLVIATVTQTHRGPGAGCVFAQTSVFTCLVELGLAVVFLLPLDVGRGERLRVGMDAQAEAALAAVACEIEGAWSVEVDEEEEGRGGGRGGGEVVNKVGGGGSLSARGGDKRSVSGTPAPAVQGTMMDSTF